jgi:hypothetical protein
MKATADSPDANFSLTLLPYFLLLLATIWFLHGWDLSRVWFVGQNLGAMFLFFFPCVAAAFHLLRLLRLPIAFCFPLGYLLMGCTYLAAGNLGFLSQWLLLLTPVVFLLPEIIFRFGFTRFCIGLISSTKRADLLTHWLFALFVALFIWNTGTASGIGTFYPSTTCDLSLIHGTLTKTFLQNGELTNPWWLRAPFIPQLNHLIFTGAMAVLLNLALRPDVALAVPSLFLFASFSAGAGYFFKEAKWVWIFGIICLGTSLTRWNLSTGYMDLPSALYIFFLFLAALDLIEKPNLRMAGLLGAMAGGAFISKQMSAYFMIPILIGALALYVFNSKKAWSHNWSLELKRLAGLAAAGAAVALTILFLGFFRNYQLTGHFLFPFFGVTEPNAFFWDKASADGFQDAIYHWRGDQSLGRFLLSLKEIATEGITFSDSVGFRIGPILPLSIICLVILGRRQTLSPKLRSTAYLILFSIILGIFGWFHSSPVIRYLFPLVFLGALSITLFLRETSGKALILTTLVLLSSMLYSVWPWLSNPRPSPPPITRDEIDAYLTPRLEGMPIFKWLRQTPADSLVYTYGASCNWDFIPRPTFGDWFGYGNYSVLSPSDPAKAQAFIRSSRVDYIIDNTRTGLPRISELLAKGVSCLKSVDTAPESYLKVYQYDSSSPDCQRPATSITDEIRKKAARGMLFDFTTIKGVVGGAQ